MLSCCILSSLIPCRVGHSEAKHLKVLKSTLQFSGDSGGPLVLWDKDKGRREKRAIIIGVVSRGTGCANFNKPGIFTKLQYHLQWIHQMIEPGNCNQ